MRIGGIGDDMLLAGVRKEVTVDPTVAPPKALGSSAFATATNAPEYLMVWQSGTRVAITVITST